MKGKNASKPRGRKLVNTTKRPVSADWQECLDRFRSHLLTSKKSEHTVNHYGADLSAFARWWKAHSHESDELTPRAVTSFDVQAWQDHLSEEPIEPWKDGKP